MKRFLILLVLLPSCLAGGSAAPRPNIIFVLTDDMGWGDLGVFHQNERGGGRKFSTPHLDAMAAEGIQLRRHYSPAPVCAPSRASLLLGVHQGHANIRNNQFDRALEDNHTLGTVMKEAGYATACIGKWGLQGPGVAADQPGRPQLRGFDFFFGYLSHRSAHFHYPEQFSGTDDQKRPMGFFEGTEDISGALAKCYSTDLITARAKKWIADQSGSEPDQPFFLYLTYATPHARLDIPTRAYPEGAGLKGGVQWTGRPGAMINTASGTINSWIHSDYAGKKGWPESAKRYATIMRRLDDAMGDLIATLADLGIDRNTLVVFTSDNGAANEAGACGTIANDPRFFESYGPLAGIKRDVLEGGIRVPVVVRWPAGIPAGKISGAPSQFHDWLPTFASLAGIPAPARGDGVSLVPTLTGKGPQQPSAVYVEYSVNGKTPDYQAFAGHRGVARKEMQAVYIGRHKGIRTDVRLHTDDFRIYDTAADPGESEDLAGRSGVPTQREFKDRVLRMRRSSPSAARGYLDSQAIPAVKPAALESGLRYRAYEMAAPWVPDWTGETAGREGIAGSPDLSHRTRDRDIGIYYSGYLKVPADGDYTFYLTTDTGAFVRLHDAHLIDADHGYAPGSEKSSGTLALTAGYHPIRIHYRHGDAAAHDLNLQWTGPGLPKREIPEECYFRD